MEKPVIASVITAPKWELPLSLCVMLVIMRLERCLANEIRIYFHVLYYASKVLNENQFNYSTTKKKLLAIVFGLEKFHSYLIVFKVILFTNHITLKYLLTKGDSKP